VAGVSFAVATNVYVSGFENALYDSQVTQATEWGYHHRQSAQVQHVRAEQFARRRLYQAQAFDGVVAAYPLYTTIGDWKISHKTVRRCAC